MNKDSNYSQVLDFTSNRIQILKTYLENPDIIKLTISDFKQLFKNEQGVNFSNFTLSISTTKQLLEENSKFLEDFYSAIEKNHKSLSQPKLFISSLKKDYIDNQTENDLIRNYQLIYILLFWLNFSKDNIINTSRFLDKNMFKSFIEKILQSHLNSNNYSLVSDFNDIKEIRNQLIDLNTILIRYNEFLEKIKNPEEFLRQIPGIYTEITNLIECQNSQVNEYENLIFISNKYLNNETTLNEYKKQLVFYKKKIINHNCDLENSYKEKLFSKFLYNFISDNQKPCSKIFLKDELEFIISTFNEYSLNSLCILARNDCNYLIEAIK